MNTPVVCGAFLVIFKKKIWQHICPLSYTVSSVSTVTVHLHLHYYIWDDSFVEGFDFCSRVLLWCYFC